MAAALVLMALGGCGQAGTTPAPAAADRIESVELADRAAVPESTRTLFERLSRLRTGIGFVNQGSPPDGTMGEISTSVVGGGVCAGDVDGDGLPDLYFTQAFGGNALYRNLGAFRFEDVTEQAGVGGGGMWGQGASFVDIDNDGDLDLYVCGYLCANRLYINRGDGTFSEQARTYGLDFDGASVMMAFADYDLDGDLDGFLVTNSLAPHQPLRQADFKPEVRDGRLTLRQDLQELLDVLRLPNGRFKGIRAGQFDHLYRNNHGEPGSPRFTDVSTEVGIYGNHYGLSATWWDYNGDGRPDLYVANDYWGPDQLFRNNGGSDGRVFTNVAPAALTHTPWFSMGADTADINNDGRLDLLASDMSGTTHYKQKIGMGDMDREGWFLEYGEPRQYMRNTLYLNSGTDRFMEVAYLTGLANTDWTWSIKFADLDNDGREDVFVSNGMVRDMTNSDLRNKADGLGEMGTPARTEFWLSSPPRREANLAFRNLGDLRFAQVGVAWGLAHVGVSYGAALADLDRDGDLDLVVNNFDEPPSVYRSHCADGHRVLIRLRGTVSNRWGIGAMVRIRTATGLQVRYLTLSRGFMSANEPLVHFGLGQDEKIDRLTVQWPGGHVQEFKNLAGDRFYTITEPEGPPPPRVAPKRQPTMFARVESLRLIRHRERPYDDYRRQPLLPNKLSQLGPGLAWGDVDGDGDEDLYIGGAADQWGRLRRNEGGGRFRAAPLPRRPLDYEAEDMAPLFFDADSDGDMDLYVVSGGVECEPFDEVLRDRLYLNDGGGKFTRAPDDALPDLRDSGSVVTAADFDRDGDLDLFVGGRSIPGQYPLSPNSRLLRNARGRFTDVTDELAPGLGRTGMVTSAVWSDADNDGWLDLVITHEWGPVKLYRNDHGKLVDRTGEAHLADRRGWWNGIAARDIDGDGDIDYAVTNFGLNTKYHATPQTPALIYYGDLDGTGNMRIVEAVRHGQTLLPVRGKSCSQNALPVVRERFPKFHDFAFATLPEIYTEQCLASAHRFEANTLESSVLINDGHGTFTFKALPRLVQVAPGFGVVLTEVDGDGSPDLYVVQNFFSPQRETGRMDGGLSLLLTGNGDGTFTPVWPDRSGLVVRGDGMGLAASDFNGDGWVDFVVGVNDEKLLAFENRGHADNRLFTVHLRGPAGNPTAVGSRVTLYLDDGSTQTAEVYAGGSYLSQSSSATVFGLGPTRRKLQVEVRWPNGQSTRTVPRHGEHTLTITQPMDATIGFGADHERPKSATGGADDGV